MSPTRPEEALGVYWRDKPGTIFPPPEELISYLSSRSPDFPGECSWLTSAARCGVAQEITGHAGRLTKEAGNRLVHEMARKTGLPQPCCQWAVDTWANVVRQGSDPAGVAASPLSVEFHSDRKQLSHGCVAKLSWQVFGDDIAECEVHLQPEPGRLPPQHSGYFVSPAYTTEYWLRVMRDEEVLAERSLTITVEAGRERNWQRWVLALVAMVLALVGVRQVWVSPVTAKSIQLSARPTRLPTPGSVVLQPQAPRGARFQLAPDSGCVFRGIYWICAVEATTEFQITVWRGATQLGTASVLVEVETPSR